LFEDLLVKLGDWIYFLVGVFVFFEIGVFIGFVFFGEMVVIFGGVVVG